MLPCARLSRVSGDSHQREPMLPCILEGVPSQDMAETLQQSAADTLISRCGLRGLAHPHNGAASSHVLRRTDAKWPQLGVQAANPPPMGKGNSNPFLGGGLCNEGSVLQSKGRDASTGSGSGSGSASERLCLCSGLQRYIQSHVFFPSLPAAGNCCSSLLYNVLT